jgi:hypothetical protein
MPGGQTGKLAIERVSAQEISITVLSQSKLVRRAAASFIRI